MNGVRVLRCILEYPAGKPPECNPDKQESDERGSVEAEC